MASTRQKYVRIADLRQYALQFGFMVTGVNCEIENTDKNTKYKTFIFIHTDCKRGEELKYNSFQNRMFKCKYCPQDKEAKYFDIKINIMKQKKSGLSEDEIKSKITTEIEQKKKQNNGEDVIVKGGGAGSKYTIEQVRNICNLRGFDLLSDVYNGLHKEIEVKHQKCGDIQKITFNGFKKRDVDRQCYICDGLEVRTGKKTNVSTEQNTINKLKNNEKDEKIIISQVSDDDIKKYVDEHKKQDSRAITNIIVTPYINVKETNNTKINQIENNSVIDKNSGEVKSVGGDIVNLKKERRMRTKKEILEEILKMGYILLSEYTTRNNKMLLEHECGHVENVSWHSLSRRYEKDPNNYCSGCSDFVSKEKEFNLDKVLKNIKEVEEKFDFMCINKNEIDGPSFSSKLKCNKCQSIKTVKFYKKDIRSCQICSSNKRMGELFCRGLLQKLFVKPFISCRPDFLRFEKDDNLELDCYNDELKLALEFQGKQHFEYVPFLHDSDINNFIYQQRKDIFKKQKCIEKKINLLEITYKDEEKGFEFIRQKVIDDLKQLGHNCDMLDEKKDVKIETEGGYRECKNLDEKIARKFRAIGYRFLYPNNKKHKARDYTIIVCDKNHHFITTYENLGRDNRGCPYCGNNKQFTNKYLDHNMYIRGWSIHTTKLEYNKNHSQNSFIEYKCKKCNGDHYMLMSNFRQMLKDKIYPCTNGCIPGIPPPVINEASYQKIYEYLHAIKMAELNSKREKNKKNKNVDNDNE